MAAAAGSATIVRNLVAGPELGPELGGLATIRAPGWHCCPTAHGDGALGGAPFRVFHFGEVPAGQDLQGLGREGEVDVVTFHGIITVRKEIVLHGEGTPFIEWGVSENINKERYLRLNKMAEEVSDLFAMGAEYQAGKRYDHFSDSVAWLSKDLSLDSFPESSGTVLEDLQQVRRHGLAPQTFTAQWICRCEIPKGGRSEPEFHDNAAIQKEERKAGEGGRLNMEGPRAPKK